MSKLCPRIQSARILIVTLIAYIFLFITSSANADSNRYKLSATKRQLLQKTIEQYRIKYGIPGISVSIIMPKSSKVLTLTSGVENIKNKKAVNANTIFQICSVTKVYTSILIFQLIGENKLKLTSTSGEFFPQYKLWRHITIKQLLNMHSGIPNYTENDKFNAVWQKHPTKFWTPTEDLSYVKNQPLLFKPGTNWHYSDSNYILLGMIIEKISGKTYAQMLQQNIIKPLHLKQTFYIPREYTKAELKMMATGYSQDDKDVMNVNMSQAGAAGAIVASTSDTARFFQAIFTGQLIGSRELKAMLVPYSTKSGKRMKANPNMFEAWAVGIDQLWLPGVGLVWNKAGGFVGFFAQANYSIDGHVTLVMAANKWLPEAFAKGIRVFIPKLYKIIGKSGT